MDDIKAWWSGVHIVTKYLFASTFALGICTDLLHVFSPSYLLLSIPPIYRSFEIWRIVTPFIYTGGLGFSFLLHLMFLYRYSQSLESIVFAGRTCDYLYMLLVTSALLFVTGVFMNFVILSTGLLMVVIYVWARKNPDTVVSFMFGIQFKAIYLAWVMVCFRMLLGGSIIMEITGILIGHIYIYFKDIYPLTGGRRFLETPQFMINLFPPAHGTGPRAQPQQPRGHQWGQGRALGAGN